MFCQTRKEDDRTYCCENCRQFIEVVDRKIEFKEEYRLEIYYMTVYNRFMRRQIKKYKYEEASYLYLAFGQIMVESIERLGLYKDIDKIFYVVSHRKKYRSRGYNQAELLATYIADYFKIPLSKGEVIKIKNTKEQNKLNKKDRLINLKDAYIYRGESLEGKNVMLIDDICTTGSTILELAKVLRQAACKKVLALALTSSKKI